MFLRGIKVLFHSVEIMVRWITILPHDAEIFLKWITILTHSVEKFEMNYNFVSQRRKFCGISPVYSHQEQTRLNFRKRVLINGNECIVLFLQSVSVQFLHSHSTTFLYPCVSSFMGEGKFYTFLFSFWNENNQILALWHVSLDLNFWEIQFYWDAFTHYQAISAFFATKPT